MPRRTSGSPTGGAQPSGGRWPEPSTSAAAFGRDQVALRTALGDGRVEQLERPRDQLGGRRALDDHAFSRRARRRPPRSRQRGSGTASRTASSTCPARTCAARTVSAGSASSAHTATSRLSWRQSSTRQGALGGQLRRARGTRGELRLDRGDLPGLLRLRRERLEVDVHVAGCEVVRDLAAQPRRASARRRRASPPRRRARAASPRVARRRRARRCCAPPSRRARAARQLRRARHRARRDRSARRARSPTCVRSSARLPRSIACSTASVVSWLRSSPRSRGTPITTSAKTSPPLSRTRTERTSSTPGTLSAASMIRSIEPARRDVHQRLDVAHGERTPRRPG